MVFETFSAGKLLISSEYVVLDGALALALPTVWGQELACDEKEDGKSILHWEAYHQNKHWLSIRIDYKSWQILETNIPASAEFIVRTLKNIQKLSPKKLQGDSSYFIKTHLQFPADYGLGSSSTLMNNLARWSGIDAFELNALSLGGSGYDIAVAQENSPILYQLEAGKRSIRRVDFNPEFRDELLFVHLNQKQDSREGIAMYRQKEKTTALIDFFSQLTEELLKTTDIDRFSELISQHEARLSAFLGIATVKQKFFADYPCFIKSLGAWGGDFVLTRKTENYHQYFQERGFSTFFSWEEIIQ